MPEGLRSILGTQIGHFIFESGHHGNLWLDLDRLFERPALIQPYISKLGQHLISSGVNTVCGPMTGGALIAYMVASEFDLHFAFTERVAPVSSESPTPVTYRLPDDFRSGLSGRRVAIVDDVINAGSAVTGSIASLRGIDVEILAVASLIVLERPGDLAFERFPIPLFSLSRLHSELWIPSECPLCQSGMPIDRNLSK